MYMEDILEKSGLILLFLFVGLVLGTFFEFDTKKNISSTHAQQNISFTIDPSDTIDLMNQCARLILKVVIGDIKDFYCTSTSSNDELYLAVYGPDNFGKITRLIQTKVSPK